MSVINIKTSISATVLVIDDDESVRDAVREGLGEAPILKLKVLEAQDTKTGLKMTKEHRPDVIILDLGFSNDTKKFGGFFFLETIRADPELKDAKVIVLTANDTFENIWIGENLDVSAYNFVSKPFNIDELIGQVYGLIR